MTNKQTPNKHAKHDLKRQHLPRLPSKRLDLDTAAMLEKFYALDSSRTPSDLLVLAAKFARRNHKLFSEYLKKLPTKNLK